jgi:hypothetical protein
MKYSITTLTTKSNYNINYVFERYPQLLKKIKDTYFIQLLYTLIDKANIKTEHTLTIEENVHVNLTNNYYMSKELVKHIEDTNYTLYTIIFDIKGIQIHVKLYNKTGDKINIKKYIHFIQLVLNLCANQSSQTKKEFHITFYLTPFEKLKPTSSIDPIHINSGYTNIDTNEIIIYRKEEWYKVFIHECFHLFCLDFNEVSINFKQIFSPLFFIESDFLFFESLVEFWARTLNIAIISFFTKKNISYEEFELLMEVNLSIERVYAIIQMKHILHAVNLSYSQMITGKCQYKETTNCFCYYVLTALLLTHYEQTMAWFVDHNQTLLQFEKNTKHVYMFYHYIRSIYKSPSFLKEIDDTIEYDIGNVSMSAFDIQF